MDTFNVAIVGGGPGCLAIIDLISQDRISNLRMKLVGIADLNPQAEGLQLAQSLGIFTTNDYRDLFTIENLNLIIELTGNPDIARSIQAEKPSHVQLTDHRIARLFWEFIRIEDEKHASEKEAEEKIKGERDNTARILNNLSDSILVMNRDLVVENTNETFLSHFKLSREEVIGKHCYEAIFRREDKCQDTFCPLADATGDTLETRSKEYILQRDGDILYYEAVHIPLKDGSGTQNGWLISLREITNRKKLELELENSQKKYKDLFQNAREGVALFDENGNILEANFALGFMLGFSKYELEHMKISDLAHKFSKAILKDNLEGLKTLQFVSVEMDFVKKNKDPLPVEANITWVPEESIFQIMLKDITFQKKLDESRRTHSEKLESEVEKRTQELKISEEETLRQKRTAEGIIYGSPIPMFVLNKDHKITHWNKAMEKLTDFLSDEMIDTDRQWEPFFPRKRPLLADLIIEGDVEKIHELYNDMKLRPSSMVEGAFEAEHFFPQLGLEGTHLYFNAAPIKDEKGDTQGSIITYQDFSERVRMTEEIERREAFVRNLIQNSIDGIVATEASGKVVVFNRGAEEILGYSSKEIVAKVNYQEILPEEATRQIWKAFYSNEHGPRGKIINLEVDFLNKQNETIPVRLSGTLLFQKKKEVGSVVFMQDLREVHKLQKEKEQAQRMASIGRTVAGLAHYIKNILNGLKGGAYVINSAVSKKDVELVEKGWGMVERNIDQISNIVMDMLIYSSERTPSYKVVDPNELVDDVLELMQERARLSEVTLAKDQSNGTKNVAMDRTAIHRCLLNLISNAIDACTLEGITAGKGLVTVKTDSPPGWGVRFEIIDNGTGITKETQKKLFTDFYTTKGYKGTGLGLPVTQKIVNEHGGRLSFETEVDRGTTFTILLPEKKTVTLKV